MLKTTAEFATAIEQHNDGQQLVASRLFNRCHVVMPLKGLNPDCRTAQAREGVLKVAICAASNYSIGYWLLIYRCACQLLAARHCLVTGLLGPEAAYD